MRSVVIQHLLTRLIVAVVFWTFMVKWVQVDFLGAVILSVLSVFVRMGLLLVLTGAIG